MTHTLGWNFDEYSFPLVTSWMLMWLWECSFSDTICIVSISKCLSNPKLNNFQMSCERCWYNFNNFECISSFSPEFMMPPLVCFMKCYGFETSPRTSAFSGSLINWVKDILYWPGTFTLIYTFSYWVISSCFHPLPTFLHNKQVGTKWC